MAGDKSDLRATLVAALDRAGIVWPDERMEEIVREARDLAEKMALVRAAAAPDEEPAFIAPPPAQRAGYG